MVHTTFDFRSEIWLHQGPSAWYFLSLPEDVADDIEEWFGADAKGFGSIRVRVTIGSTTWETSIFPDDGRGTYVLPVKKPVRKAEDLDDGSPVAVTLEVLG